MSITQRDLKAEEILRRAQQRIAQGMDSVTAHEAGCRELDRLGYGIADLRYYKQRLSKITGWRG